MKQLNSTEELILRLFPLKTCPAPHKIFTSATNQAIHNHTWKENYASFFANKVQPYA